MSDAKLRDLERRWRDTCSPADEAAWLLERVRVGDVTREHLELAAHCGHEGAAFAVGASLARPGTFREWIREAGRQAKAIGCEETVRLSLVQLGARLRQREGYGGRGPCRTFALRTFVAWARQSGATTAEVRAAVAAAVLAGKRARRRQVSP